MECLDIFLTYDELCDGMVRKLRMVKKDPQTQLEWIVKKLEMIIVSSEKQALQDCEAGEIE